MTPFNVAIVRWIRGAFDFRTRSTRADYWWPRLLVLGVNVLMLMVFVGAIGDDGAAALLDWVATEPDTLDDFPISPLPSLATFALVFGVVFGVLTFIPDLAVSWRRFHDLGQPGWLHLLFILAGALFPLASLGEMVWFAMPGQRHSNRYGQDPLDSQADVF